MKVEFKYSLAVNDLVFAITHNTAVTVMNLD